MRRGHEIIACPNCGSGELEGWSQDTVHGEASGYYCEECGESCGDGEKNDSPAVYELAAYTYGQSRSGKTAYATPVIVMKDSPTRPETHVMIRTFFIWPCDTHPQGELNAASEMWKSRIVPFDALTDGYITEDGARIKAATTPEFLEALARMAANDRMPPSTLRATRTLINP